MDKTLSQLEDAADSMLRRSKSYIPHLARLCLISTFLDDAIRMWFQWSDQADYVNITWRCGAFLANMFVLWNMLAQLVGCGMVLLRKMVPLAVGLLSAVIVIQVSTVLVQCQLESFPLLLALVRIFCFHASEEYLFLLYS